MNDGEVGQGHQECTKSSWPLFRHPPRFVDARPELARLLTDRLRSRTFSMPEEATPLSTPSGQGIEFSPFSPVSFFVWRIVFSQQSKKTSVQQGINKLPLQLPRRTGTGDPVPRSGFRHSADRQSAPVLLSIALPLYKNKTKQKNKRSVQTAKVRDVHVARPFLSNNYWLTYALLCSQLETRIPEALFSRAAHDLKLTPPLQTPDG